MQLHSTVILEGNEIACYQCNTIVVGSGAAGYGAALRVHQLGQPDVAILCEHTHAGTSRNTGSDKQTYYKLTLAGSLGDSVYEMAQTLYDGHCVDGEHALCEAALSTQCFYALVELGVPFPHNAYGEYVGYKTDHAPRYRATSAGPYTSKMMTEVLEAAVLSKNISVFDKKQVVKILTDGTQVLGVLTLNISSLEKQKVTFSLFCCKNLVYATGGPAGMYANSAYPHGQYGSTGLAFEAGVRGKNLTEWQYGLASVKPRWNVSGSYMQVLPRFISTDSTGGDEREFMNQYFASPTDMLGKVFLKGYQWPFDIQKVNNGSSIIDILVQQEHQKGRRVFLDFTQNPGGVSPDYLNMPQEAVRYLRDAGICFGTPIERLEKLNAPAAEMYRKKGVDLAVEPLEIALCAQHNNGGLWVDAHWQTNIQGLFAVGEVAATHGVYRPGGSALNAGQVGGLRAAQYINQHRKGDPQSAPGVAGALAKEIIAVLNRAKTALKKPHSSAKELWRHYSAKMSDSAGAMRSQKALQSLLVEIEQQIHDFERTVGAPHVQEVAWVFRLWDTLQSQKVYLGAMLDYIKKGGESRGSALYHDPKGKLPCDGLPNTMRYVLDEGRFSGMVQETCLADGNSGFIWRSVAPIPAEDIFFENVWRAYREDKGI